MLCRGRFVSVRRAVHVFGGLSQQAPPDASSDPRRGGLDGIPSEMRVARGGLHLRVTQEFPNHRQTLTKCQCP